MTETPASAPISHEQLRSAIAAELDHVRAIRRRLHRCPELMFDLPLTSGVVRHELESLSIAHKAGLAGGSGVVAYLPATEAAPGSAVALRADMDALPIREETGLDYASEHDGVMHACGHDGHTATLLGAARVLSRLPRLNPVLLIFQPAEEGGAGGKKMCEEGALDGSLIGPPASRIFGLHCWPMMPLGRVGTRHGPLLASADEFEATITGRQAHAAWPHGSRDPIVAAAACITALQTIVSRNTDPLDSVVVTVGIVRAGTAQNIIPANSYISGTVRALSEQMRAWVKDRVRDVIAATASAYGCAADVTWMPDGYPVTHNDPDMAERVFAAASDVVGPERTDALERPVMGGEDFAFYGAHVPACFFCLGTKPEGVDDPPLMHTPKFDFNDAALPIGIEMMCRLALQA